MKGNLETAWLRSTAGERQDFVELFAADIREMLPSFDDRDRLETEEELIGHGQDDDGGDDETLDAPELPAVLDTNDSDDDDGGFRAADHDEAFPVATQGIKRRAGGKPHPAAPSSKDDIERMTREFLARGGEIRRVERGLSGLAPTKSRVPAWRQKKVSSKGEKNDARL